MARQVIVAVWCDWCQQNEVQTEGEELPPVQIGGQKARVPALCEGHRKEIWEPFVEMLQLAVTVDRINAMPVPKRAPNGGVGQPPGLVKHPVELAGGYSLPRGIPEERAGEYTVTCPIKGCMELQKNASTTSAHLRNVHQTSLYDAIGPEGKLLDINGDEVDTPRPRIYKKHPRHK